MGRDVVVRIVTLCALGAALLASAASPAAAATNWQAGVDASVELTVRTPDGGHYTADFALTSPKGATRHARVASAEDGSAHVDFGGSASTQWGPPDGKFYPSEAGRWTWSCMVSGRTVAHGSFAIARTAGGSSSITVLRPEF